MNLDFEDGRATVDLKENITLSIINHEREVTPPNVLPPFVVNMIDPSWEKYPVAQCDETTFEVALLHTPTGNNIHVVPAGWDEHLLDDNGWHIFTFVPMTLIDQYVQSIGLSEKAEK